MASIRSCTPKAALTGVTPPEVHHVLGVVWVFGKIVDPSGKMLAGLEMAGSVAVALVLGGIEREVDHRPQQEGGGERMALPERVGGPGQEPVMVAVEFVGPSHDEGGGAVECGPVDQEGERLMEAGGA